MDKRWVGKVAIVTGASSGIGAAICEKLTKDGLKVVGFARREERVQELAKKLKCAKGKLYAVKCDVTKEEDAEKAFKWVKENVGPVQILINNAGVCRVGTLIESKLEDIRNVVDTNIMGICICTREGYKQMKEADLEGHIIHINSVAGHWNITGNPPSFNIYSASKHAVTVMTETMRREITHSGSKVKISSVSPGAVKTEIAEAAGIKIEPGTKWDQMPMLQAADIADSVAYVISTPPNVLIQELIVRPMGEVNL